MGLKQKLFTATTNVPGADGVASAPSTITTMTDAHKNVVFEGDVAAAEGSTKPVQVAVEM